MANSGKSTSRTVSTATPVIAWSTTRRRKLMVGTLIGGTKAAAELELLSGNAFRRLASSNAPHHDPRQRVDHNGDKEQRQAYLDQRGKIQIAGRFGEFVGEYAGHGVSGSKQRLGNFRTVADHHGYRHGFAERKAQAQNDGAHDSRPRIAQHTHADHFPARRTQRQHRFTLVLRNDSEHFAGDGRDDGNDHDRQNYDRGQHADAVGRSAEQACPAERLGKKRLGQCAEYWAQDEELPKTVNK